MSRTPEQEAREQQWREHFEERMFNARFISSIVNTGLGGAVTFMSKDCPMKADFVARNEDGTYKDDSLNIAWFGYRACAEKANVRVQQDALRIAQLDEVRNTLYDRIAAVQAELSRATSAELELLQHRKENEAEIERLKAEREQTVSELMQERSSLANAITQTAIDTGLISADTPGLTIPHLLMFCADFTSRIAQLQAQVDRLKAIQDGLDFEPSEMFTIADMANIGRALMDKLPAKYGYNDSPVEIVTDLSNQLHDAEARIAEIESRPASSEPIDTVISGEELAALHEWSKPDGEAAIRLFVADNELHMCSAEYPDEGSVFLADLNQAQPAAMETVCCGRKECGGECGNEWQGMSPTKEALEPCDPAERAAWMLDCYAEVIRAAPAAEIERHPYLPEVEEVARLLRAQPPAAQVPDEAYATAKRLAEWVWTQHYHFDAPHWKPCDDLLGVLSQIDNMLTGLARKQDAAQVPDQHLQRKALWLIAPSLASLGWVVHMIRQSTGFIIRQSRQLADSSPDDLRADGWTVAVHNDYRLNGLPHTFWLFTKGDKAIKGEGRSDAEALNACRAAMLAAPTHKEPSV